MSTSNYNGTYSVAEQVAAFTFSVNAAADFAFTDIADMQSYVSKIAALNLADTTMQGFIGSDWTQVWGPVVWVNPSQTGNALVVDNTMACYFSPSQNLFVIAIAGTNPISMFDWEDEDFAIDAMVQWNQVSSGAPASAGYISVAASTGIAALLQMTSSNTTLLAALEAYINANNVTGATIAVGGHSLGGVLAPCFGLYMNDNLSSLGLTGQNIAVYAYAGPTPGNQSFATYYQSQINGTTFSYSSVYNSLDVIPLGMAPTDLASIPTIYDFAGGIPAETSPVAEAPADTFMGIVCCGLQVAGEVGTMSASLLGGYYTQVATNRTENTGTFNADIDANCAKQLAALLVILLKNGQKDSPYQVQFSNVIRFVYQMAAQHGPAYCGGTLTVPFPNAFDPSNTYTTQPVAGFLGIAGFTTEFQSNLTNNPPANATFESWVSRSFKKLAGIDLSKIRVKK